MEMADYLGDKGVPVTLVIPFDATQSFPAPGNVSRVVNLTQRDYAYMKPGPGFRGSLANVDVSGDPDISHTNIDKSPRLHARAISEVLPVVGGRRVTTLGALTQSDLANVKEGLIKDDEGYGLAMSGRAPLDRKGFVKTGYALTKSSSWTLKRPPLMLETSRRQPLE